MIYEYNYMVKPALELTDGTDGTDGMPYLFMFIFNWKVNS